MNIPANWTISDVYQNQRSDNRIAIFFTVENRAYQLILRKNSWTNEFYPLNIYHVTNDGDCPYCNKFEIGCTGLYMYKNDLFRRLIEFPNIRLEWLYIDHV